MTAHQKVKVEQRLCELGSGETQRLLESTLRPLALAGQTPSTSETVAVPVELLLNRFKNLDNAVTRLNEKLRRQDELLRKNQLGDWFRMAVLIALTWGITTTYSRVYTPSRTPVAQSLHAAATP